MDVPSNLVRALSVDCVYFMPSESMVSTTTTDACLGIGAVLLLATFVGWLMALAGARGARLLGGIAAGVLLGPSVVGAVWPNEYGRYILGGSAEQLVYQQALRTVEARRFAEMHSTVTAAEGAAAADATGAADAGAAAKERAEESSAVLESRTALDASRVNFVRPSAAMLILLSAVVLLGFAPSRPMVSRPAGTGTPVSPRAPIASGVWLAAVPAAASLLTCWLLFDQRLTPMALFTSACTAAGCGLLGRDDRQLAESAEADGVSTLFAMGMVSTLVAFGIAAAAIATSGSEPTMWIALAAALACYLLGTRIHTTKITGLANRVALPGIAALALCRVPILNTAWLLSALAFAVIAADGRWVGAFLGSALSTDRAASRSMKLAAAAEGSAPTQTAFVGLAVAAAALSGPVTIAMLISAWLLQFGAPLRRRWARDGSG